VHSGAHGTLRLAKNVNCLFVVGVCGRKSGMIRVPRSSEVGRFEGVQLEENWRRSKEG
jgi:hypothetical protein